MLTMAPKNKFDVALSFANAQRKYVDEVANLIQSYGYTVFYDKFYEAHLWGKELTAYFKEVYYSNSDKCIMFISKEYVTNAWPSHERQNALAKVLEVGDNYLLPVRFDDSEIPGLPPTICYLDAREKSPREIADLFLKKIES